MNFSGILSDIIYYVGMVVEYISVVVVVVAVIIALIHLISRREMKENIRAEFAKNIMFGLEFVIAADILLVTVARDLTEILQLGGMVVIRILLGYALRKELPVKKKK